MTAITSFERIMTVHWAGKDGIRIPSRSTRAINNAVYVTIALKTISIYNQFIHPNRFK